MAGSARVCRSEEGSKRRSRVEVNAVSLRVGIEVIAGRKGAASGLSSEEAMFAVFD
jgi:hypothetical protein